MFEKKRGLTDYREKHALNVKQTETRLCLTRIAADRHLKQLSEKKLF